ncbi:MAG TPA: sulfatase-like hydrolase/transferase, partial [Xanthobacteraceae bacterium]|nr:sulfatase-like hydrolase/transferase [Xanthobacteraceae bacterium]
MNGDQSKTKFVNSAPENTGGLKRRELLLGSSTLLAAASLLTAGRQSTAQAQQPAAPGGQRPNIVVIWGDDIGISDLSAYTQGLMGFRTPNIDRIANEGVLFTDFYAEQSCTAGRA